MVKLVWEDNGDYGNDMSEGFEPFPDGCYQGKIIKLEVLPVKNKPNINTVKATYNIKDLGKREVWHYFNLASDSEQAKAIARAQFNRLLRAVKLKKVTNTDQLINKWHFIELRTEPGKGDFPPRNKIVDWKALDSIDGVESAKDTSEKANADPVTDEVDDDVPW